MDPAQWKLLPGWCCFWKALHFINYLKRNHFVFMLICDIFLPFGRKIAHAYLLNTGQTVWKREIMAILIRELEPLLKHRSPCCFKQLFQMLVKWKGQNHITIKEHKGSHYPPISTVRSQPVFKAHLSIINFFTYKCHPKWTFYSWLIFVLFLICKYKSKMHISGRFPLCWLKSWFSSYLLPSALAEKWLFKPQS